MAFSSKSDKPTCETLRYDFTGVLTFQRFFKAKIPSTYG